MSMNDLHSVENLRRKWKRAPPAARTPEKSAGCGRVRERTTRTNQFGSGGGRRPQRTRPKKVQDAAACANARRGQISSEVEAGAVRSAHARKKCRMRPRARTRDADKSVRKWKRAPPAAHTPEKSAGCGRVRERAMRTNQFGSGGGRRPQRTRPKKVQDAAACANARCGQISSEVEAGTARSAHARKKCRMRPRARTRDADKSVRKWKRAPPAALYASPISPQRFSCMMRAACAGSSVWPRAHISLVTAASVVMSPAATTA